jgi:hypothetical protein
LPAAAQIVADDNPPAPRIVNGLSTFGFPSTGALLSPGDPATASAGCSGVMIGCETFLTAAHCVCPGDGATCAAEPPDPSSFLVYLQHAGFFAVASIALRSDYSFPVADVAVLALAAPVTGIVPTPIDTAGPAFGSAGTIVGFGRSGGPLFDYGIKRYGQIETAPCPAEISDVTSVCWDFTVPMGPPGDDSNTCNGDSGGPLFVDYGSGPVVAGVTSGGFNTTCLADDTSFDAKVAHYSTWIEQQGGADLANTACGTGGQVGDGETAVFGFAGQVDGATPDQIHSVDVEPGRGLLRVSMNARDTSSRNFDLYVKAGSPPTTSDFDCAATGVSQYGFCEFAQPASGTWYVLIHRVAGGGEYQSTVTLFGPDCSDPLYAGAPCDDGNPCTENDVCQSGACAGAPAGDGTSCDDGNPCTRPDTCQSGVCINEAIPAACRDAAKTLLLVKDKGGPRDKLIWKWLKGASTSQAEFGDPTDATSYSLCLYAGTTQTLVGSASLPPSPAAWAPVGDKGYQYKDKAGTVAGLQRVILKGSDNDRAKIVVKGKGSDLPLPALPLAAPVRIQLMDGDSEICWESALDSGDFIANDTATFKAKSAQ